MMAWISSTGAQFAIAVSIAASTFQPRLVNTGPFAKVQDPSFIFRFFTIVVGGVKCFRTNPVLTFKREHLLFQGMTEAGATAGSLLSCRLYSPKGTARDHPITSEDFLCPSDGGCRPFSYETGFRLPLCRRDDRHALRSSHLDAGIGLSSPCPLSHPGRGAFPRQTILD